MAELVDNQHRMDEDHQDDPDTQRTHLNQEHSFDVGPEGDDREASEEVLEEPSVEPSVEASVRVRAGSESAASSRHQEPGDEPPTSP